MRGERKKFEMKGVFRVTKRNPRLGNTVAVFEACRQYVCYITFSEDLVHFVGEKLPRGVADFDPAFLVVTENTQTGLWTVEARYQRDDISAVLWTTKSRPQWLKTKT